MGERPFRRVLSGPCEQEPAGGDLAERRRVPPHVCNGRRTSGGRSLGTILLNVARHHLIKSDLIGCELVSPGLSFPHQAPLALFRSFQPSLLPHDYLDNGDACALRVRTLRASPNRITAARRRRARLGLAKRSARVSRHQPGRSLRPPRRSRKLMRPLLRRRHVPPSRIKLPRCSCATRVPL